MLWKTFLFYGEHIWIWTYVVHVLPASSRSVCFLSSVPTLPFLRYGTTILVPSCVRHTYLCRLQYKFLRIPSTGFFSSNTDTCIPVLPYKVKTLLWRVDWFPTEFSVPVRAYPSAQWTESARLIHHSYLLQRDDQHHCVSRTIAVAYTLFPPHPMIHVSLHTGHASAPALQ